MAKQAKNANPMTQDELLGLQHDVATVGLRDVEVGRVLDGMLSHLARLNNLDYPVVVDASVEEASAAPEADAAPAEAAPSQEGAQ